jgi:hypothetical protein
MESKLNYKAIEAYAEEYSTKLCNKLYKNQDALSGDDILKFPVRQSALLVLNTIYQMWALEAEKLQSPYFDYKNKKVQLGLQKLMNVLSKNILVNRESLESILSSSVYDSLLLLISPYSYYKLLLEKEDSNLEILKATEKFIIVNKDLLINIIAKVSASEELMNKPSHLLDEVFNEFNGVPQNADNELKKFAELHPFSDRDFYEEDEVVPAIPAHEFSDDDAEEESEKTLNDAFEGESYQTVADTLNNSEKNSTLKSMLSINQKFMFINDLFNDSQDDFNKVLDFLENCEDKEAASSFIHNNYLKNNIWNANAPQVKDFLALLDKKFSI